MSQTLAIKTNKLKFVCEVGLIGASYMAATSRSMALKFEVGMTVISAPAAHAGSAPRLR